MKVLVIEDDPTAADLLQTRLKNLGCEPLLALDAEDGMRLARTAGPDLILLDLKLDDTITSGMQLLKLLRADPQTAQIPVFIHSIYMAARGDVPEAEALADGYLLKPFKLRELQGILDGFRAYRSQAEA